jgi:hypothetical protein
MKKCFSVLNQGKYASIIISDFTVNKEEVCVQKDIVDCMLKCDFNFVGTTVLLQDNKPLYPFWLSIRIQNKSYAPKYNKF